MPLPLIQNSKLLFLCVFLFHVLWDILVLHCYQVCLFSTHCSLIYLFFIFFHWLVITGCITQDDGFCMLVELVELFWVFFLLLFTGFYFVLVFVSCLQDWHWSCWVLSWSPAWCLSHYCCLLWVWWVHIFPACIAIHSISWHVCWAQLSSWMHFAVVVF